MEIRLRKVFKYPIDIIDLQYIMLPKDAEIISAQIQGENEALCLWALVDPNAENKKRLIKIAGTGHEIHEADLKFINTFQIFHGKGVFHVFEVIKN